MASQRFDRAGQDQTAAPQRLRLELLRMAAVSQRLDMVERRLEVALVGVMLERGGMTPAASAIMPSAEAMT
jgi:hypothetical protein